MTAYSLIERHAARHGGLVILPRDAAAIAGEKGVDRGWLREAASALVAAGDAVRVERGTYLLPVPDGPQPLAIATELGGSGAYVSLWAAAAHHGLVTSDTSAIAVVTARHRRPLAIEGLGVTIHFRSTGPERLFGAAPARVGSVLARIASPERLLIDLLWFPEDPSSPPPHEVLAAWEGAIGRRDFNSRLLTSYALRMGSGRLVRRVGYLMEHFRLAGAERLADATGTETNLIALLPGTPLDWERSARWRIDPGRER